jgi:acyl dehydratase
MGVPQPAVWGPIDVTAADVARFGRGIDVDDLRPHPLYVAKVLIPGSAQILLSSALEARVDRIVHAGLELSFGGPVRRGHPLTCHATLDSVDDKGSGRLIAIAVRICDDEATICEGVTRYFERGDKRGGRSEASQGLSGGEVRIIPTHPDQSLRYAEGSGDRFPIHTDDAFARRVGLPGKIMHGMCTLALSVEGAVEDVHALRSLSCRFANILRPGEAITLRRCDNEAGCRFEARRPDGKVVIQEGICGL